MENYEQRTSLLTWLLGGLTLLLLAGGTYYWNQNRGLSRLSDRAEQRADSLTSVRLQLENDMQRLNGQLATTQSEKAALTEQLDDTRQQLTRNEQRLTNARRELRRSTARRDLTIRDLDERVTTLTTKRDSLTNQMEAMGQKIGWLTDSNSVLSQQNSQLGQQVSTLNDNLLTMVPRSTLTADNFRVEATKANKKETAKAKKVRTLTVSMDVPAGLNLSGHQEVYLSLINPQQPNALPPLRTLTVNLDSMNKVVPVHAVQTVDFGKASQRITFQLLPQSLKPGLYRAAVYTKSAYLGAVEVNFRDSFWFF